MAKTPKTEPKPKKELKLDAEGHLAESDLAARVKKIEAEIKALKEAAVQGQAYAAKVFGCE